MVARRDIKKGEEVTYDYATSETAENFVLSCN
jgi:SET domain-containing protein